MIAAEKLPMALSALHQVLLQARKMGYESVPSTEIADVLDTAEFLVVLLMSKEDEVGVFRENLESLAARLDQFRFAVECFDGS